MSVTSPQALAPLLLAVYIAMLGIGVVVPVMPVFAASLGAGGFTLGLIIAAFSVSRGLCQPLCGALSDRYGRRRFLVAGLLVYALVGLLIPAAGSVVELVCCRALHGVGSAMIVPVAMACVGDQAPPGQEGRAMALLNIAIFGGMGSGPLLGGICTDLWGMASAFHAMACMSAVALLLVLRLPFPAVPASQKPKGTGLWAAMLQMLRHRSTRGLLLSRMGTMILMVPTMAFLPLFLQQRFQVGGVWIGLIISARTLVNALLQQPCGRLADKGDRVCLLRIGVLVLCSVLWCIPLATGPVMVLLLFIILGVGEALVWATLSALATSAGRDYGQGTMMGVYNLAMSCGVFLGAMTAGLIADLMGLSWTFVLIGLLVLAVTLAASRDIAAS